MIYAKPAIDNYGKVYYVSNNIIGRNSSYNKGGGEEEESFLSFKKVIFNTKRVYKS